MREGLQTLLAAKLKPGKRLSSPATHVGPFGYWLVMMERGGVEHRPFLFEISLKTKNARLNVLELQQFLSLIGPATQRFYVY